MDLETLEEVTAVVNWINSTVWPFFGQRCKNNKNTLSSMTVKHLDKCDMPKLFAALMLKLVRNFFVMSSHT